MYKGDVFLRVYNVDEAFEILKEYKITTHKESVRRWLREGNIQANSPVSKKEGWRIKQSDLFDFIHERLPKRLPKNVEDTKIQSKEEIRSEMWWELVKKNIFEDFIHVKKKQVQECIEHLRMSKEFEGYIWRAVSNHKRGYKTPRIPYLLDAFLFDGKRILMNTNFEETEEKILFALIEHLRLKQFEH